MVENFIDRQVKKNIILRLIVAAILFFSFSGGMYFLLPLIIVTYSPAKELTVNDPLNDIKLKPMNHMVYISVPKKDIVKIGEKVSYQGELQAIYAVVPFQGKNLVFAAPLDFFRKNLNKDTWKLQGEIKTREYEAQKAIKQLATELDVDLETLETKLYPNMLVCDNLILRFIVLTIIVLLYLLSALFFFRQFISLVNPSKRLYYEYLAEFGDVDQIKNNIDRELNESVVYKTSNITITGSWIIKPGIMSLTIIPIDQIVWVYKCLIRGRRNDNQLKVCIDSGIVFTLSFFTEKMVDEVSKFISEKYPWIIVGYEETLMERWNEDHTQFKLMVEDRKDALNEM